MNVTIRPMKDSDIVNIENNLLDINKEEIMAMRGQTVSELFEDDENIKNMSEIIEIDGKIIAVGGGIDTNEGHIVWLFGTKDLQDHKKQFAIITSRRFEELKKCKSLLFSYVFSKNEITKQWLKNLGFNIMDGEPMGLNGEIFHRFEWRRPCV